MGVQVQAEHNRLHLINLLRITKKQETNMLTETLALTTFVYLRINVCELYPYIRTPNYLMSFSRHITLLASELHCLGPCRHAPMIEIMYLPLGHWHMAIIIGVSIFLYQLPQYLFCILLDGSH